MFRAASSSVEAAPRMLPPTCPSMQPQKLAGRDRSPEPEPEPHWQTTADYRPFARQALPTEEASVRRAGTLPASDCHLGHIDARSQLCRRSLLAEYSNQ